MSNHTHYQIPRQLPKIFNKNDKLVQQYLLFLIKEQYKQPPKSESNK